MAGRNKASYRNGALAAARRAAELAAAGDTEGAARASALAADLAKYVKRLEQNPAYVPDGDRMAAEDAVRKAEIRARQEAKKSKRPVRSSAAFGLAAEAVTAGVRKDVFSALPSPAAPEPLSPEEIWACKAAVLSSGEDNSGELSDPDMVDSYWLASAFPDLTPDARIRCGRFLAAVSALAASAPERTEPGDTVVERALRAAGLTWTAFESARSKDSRFDTAQAAVTAARKRAVMALMEERLWDRAYNGQLEEALTRDGDTVEVRKFDNNLAFNLLKYGHEQYAKQMVKDKAAANAMTLMVANGFTPKAVPAPREPKPVNQWETPHGQ